MVQRKIQKIIKFILIAIVAVAVFGFVVMGLWNWLMPAVFGWHAITFWQAVGLLVFASSSSAGSAEGRVAACTGAAAWKEKWAQMSPEEREKFSRGMGARFGRHGCWTDAEKAESL